MHNFATLASYALLASFGGAELLTVTPTSSDPTITPAPDIPMELFRKQNNDRFMGWLSISGSYISRTCDVGGTYYQSGNYWRCCPTTVAGCNVPLGCAGGNLIYRLSTSGTQTASLTTIPCTSAYASTDSTFSICNTGFLYENTADSDALTNIFCGVSSVNWSYYRVRPSVTTSSSSSTSASPVSTLVTTTTSAGSDFSTGSPAIASSSKKKKKGGSKAWIAGVVIGPLIALALLAGIILFFRRKKKSKPTQPPPMVQQNNVPNNAAPSYPGSPNPAPVSPYYENPQKPNGVPYGVASQESWAPQSPLTPSSVSPQPQNSPYGVPPAPQQGWQTMPMQGQQMYPPPQMTGSPPPMTVSPPPQHTAQVGGTYKQPGVEERPFSAELDGTGHRNLGGQQR